MGYLNLSKCLLYGYKQEKSAGRGPCGLWEDKSFESHPGSAETTMRYAPVPAAPQITESGAARFGGCHSNASAASGAGHLAFEGCGGGGHGGLFREI